MAREGGLAADPAAPGPLQPWIWELPCSELWAGSRSSWLSSLQEWYWLSGRWCDASSL